MKEHLQAALATVLAEMQLDAGGPVQLDPPRDRSHGDFATNIALILAKRVGRPPQELAREIASRLQARADLGATVTLAGPGFLNFKVESASVHATLRALLAQGNRIGRSEAARGQRVQIEFVSANPTGPLNVVNARAAAFGSTLGRLFECAGAEIETEFYVNDAGRQVEMLGASVRARRSALDGVEEAFPAEGYQGDYVRELAAAVPAESVRAWRALPAGDSDRAFGSFAVERMLASHRADLERFGVRFSRWFRESELHASGAVQSTLKELQASGHVYETDGALFFRTTTWGDDKDRVLVRSEGAPTYFLADAAYHRDKHARGFTRVIDVWGPDHHGHIPRMQAVARALGYPEEWLEVVIIQWVKLMQRGEALKMSKREGRLVTLADLMGELGPSGPDVAKYYFLMRQQSSHLDFDLDLARQQSDENPVFYVKMAHARICGIVAKAAEAGLRLATLETDGALPQDVALERLTTAEELDLVQRLADFASLVARAAAAREPHRLTNYCEETARAFHQFYHHHRVVQDDLELGRARLALCHATRRVLASALDLMAISAPQSM